MEKGLRCPNCDTTINRRTVHDWISNKTVPHLRCANQFCNVQWSRDVLLANAHLFSGELAPEPEDPVKDSVPDEVIPEPKVTTPSAPELTTPDTVDVTPPDAVMGVESTPKKSKNDWLTRVRKIARGHAKAHGIVSIDVLRRWSDENNDRPESSSAWGAVFQTDEWESVSTMRSTYRSNRSRNVKVWSLKSALPVVAGA
ncbi:MAG: hypothetical protein AB7L09_02725 [Nitrospira sp.]